METPKIDIHMNDGQKELTIIHREGQAEAIFKPRPVTFFGTLEAPFEYFQKRKEKTINTDYTHLQVDYRQKIIKLIVDEHKDNGVMVIGTVLIFKDFEELGINTNKMYTIDGLREAIKFKGVYFKNRDEHVELMGKLVNYKAKIDTVFSNANDFKGNTATEKAISVSHEIPLNFMLNMPVVLGKPNEDIAVEVCVDAASGSLRLWLECIELKTRIDGMVNDMINTEVDNFKGEIVKIVVG